MFFFLSLENVFFSNHPQCAIFFYATKQILHTDTCILHCVTIRLFDFELQLKENAVHTVIG